MLRKSIDFMINYTKVNGKNKLWKNNDEVKPVVKFCINSTILIN